MHAREEKKGDLAHGLDSLRRSEHVVPFKLE